MTLIAMELIYIANPSQKIHPKPYHLQSNLRRARGVPFEVEVVSIECDGQAGAKTT